MSLRRVMLERGCQLVAGNDPAKITQFNGLCELGKFDEYWLRPGAWTRKFRREMLACGVPLCFWTHYALLCCGDIVTKLWEKEFETPGNAEPGWQPALLLEIQDDSGEVPYTHRRDWPFFVRWLCGQFKNPGLYQIQRRVFEDFTRQRPGESVYQYNHRWNLEKELLDELASANMYAPGTYSCLLEDIYIRSLLLPLGNKLRDLKAVGTTLLKILPNLRGAQDPGHEEEVKLPLEIKFLQEHAVEIEKDQLVSLELHRLETGTSRLISSRKTIISPSPSFARSTSSHPRVHNLSAPARITELESGSELGDNPTAQFYHKLRGQGRTLWSREQMQRLWAERRCFKCGGADHQSADCNNTPADPKHFRFSNLVSEAHSAYDDTCGEDVLSAHQLDIPHDVSIFEYLQSVEAAPLN